MYYRNYKPPNFIWTKSLEKAKVIPGGTMLFSKNPDLFTDKWPAYFSKVV